jgi:hypothetical protein
VECVLDTARADLYLNPKKQNKKKVLYNRLPLRRLCRVYLCRDGH